MKRWLDLNWQLIRPYGRYVYYGLFPARRPTYFQDAWKYPCRRLGVAACPPQPGSPGEPAFLFFPMNDWHARTQRSQHLARALARSGRLCIYVNPHLGLEYPLPYFLSESPRLCTLEENLLELHVHLPREHELNQRLLLPGEVRRIVQAIQRALDDTGVRRGVSLTSLPVWLDVVERLREDRGFPILYDCHDLLAGFDGISPEVAGSEDRLMRVCDRVAFSSSSLMETMLARYPSVRAKAALIRNAVNPADFQFGESDRGKAPRRVVGYMGALDRWFDCDAILEAARAHPALEFVLAGAVQDARILRLKECPNIRFTGEVPYAELRNLMATWAVATIPFLRNPLTLATNPIKLYEYFSAGLPVVGTRLPELELFSDLTYIADSPRQFAECIAKAMEETDATLPARRKAVAARETWTERANALCALVEGARSFEAVIP
jgi:glycosyltransferase involved in cell wall biosynthesis